MYLPRGEKSVKSPNSFERCLPRYQRNATAAAAAAATGGTHH